MQQFFYSICFFAKVMMKTTSADKSRLICQNIKLLFGCNNKKVNNCQIQKCWMLRWFKLTSSKFKGNNLISSKLQLCMNRLQENRAILICETLLFTSKENPLNALSLFQIDRFSVFHHSTIHINIIENKFRNKPLILWVKS